MAAPDEAQPISLVGHRAALGPAHHHQVQHPGRCFIPGTRAAGTQDRRLRVEQLGLHKQVAERRMQRIGGGRCENHFGVAGDLDDPAGPGTVADADPAQFDVVFRRDHDLGVSVDLMVVAAKLGAALGKNRFVVVRQVTGRLIGS